MATILKKGTNMPLYFTSGTVLVLKSTKFPFAMVPFTLTGPSRKQIQLGIYNNNGDTILHIKFGMVGKRHVMFCNDRVYNSLGDGWGKEQKADTSYVDFERWRQSGVTISVHHHSTESEFGQYQILLGNVTVCNFNKRLPGPATQISYRGDITFGPESWTLSSHQVSDLHPREREILVQQISPSPEIPALEFESMAISIRPSHFIPTQKCASVSWDDGKEIRMYYGGPGNVLHEYAYSANEDGNPWSCGTLHSLKIILDPTSSVAAIRLANEMICIYYQDPNNDFIRMVYQLDPTQPWLHKALPIAKAVKGSSISIIEDPDANKIVSRIYYQDPKLRLCERYYDHLGSTDQWVLDEFNPGVQLQGTPMTAEVVHGEDVNINVTWRDAHGRVVSGSWSKSSGWNLPNPDGGRAVLDGWN